MKKLFKAFIVLFFLMIVSPRAFATNGDNLIAVGPIARSMGGVGIAYPLDAISAVFANPAAMCFGPYCPSSEFNFAATAFMPSVKGKVSGPAVGGGTIEADSAEKVYPIPAIGISTPISKTSPYWRFGLSAYGVTGLGVDYRGTDLDQSSFAAFGGFPLVQGEYTNLQIMKFAPAIAFQPFDKWSFGLAFQIDYGSLDLRDGTSSDFGFGVQAGVIYKPTDSLSLGFTYTSPQSAKYDNVKEFDNPPNGLDSLELEAPQQVGVGAAYKFLNNRLLIEADVKWIDWSGAAGYSDFDWDDQWVFAIGAQFEPIDKLSLRVGFNYGENPVKTHDNFNGTGFVDVQGHPFLGYYYETFRIIGFPAIVQKHLTFGAGYEFSPRFSLNFGVMYGFEETITETGTGPNGLPVTLESTLSEWSIDFGLTWRF